MTMKHYGNVTKINGAEVEPVDIITFGSPCHDLSVAGKRAGIQDGERSNLFFEAIRIIKEMREATNGEHPKYAVWENVPGAFSSNKGSDFHAVLEALCSVCDDTVSIPEPYDKRKPDKLVWNKSGEIVGDNYSIAWRTLDAQYWGVPQRRKRIYLVADFTGRRAGEILFKQDGLSRHMQTSNETGQGSSADAVGSVDGSVGVECLAVDGYNQTVSDICGSIRAGKADQDHVGCTVYSFDSLSSNSMKSSNPFSGCRAVEIAKCIDTTYPDPSKNQGGVAVVECLGYDMYNQASTGDKTRTLKTPAGGDDLPVVCVLNDQGGSSINEESDEISPTLRANSHQHEPVIALQANGIDQAYGIDHVITTGGNCTAQGSCVYEDTQATLKAGGVHAVCYPLNEQIILRHGALGRNTGFGAGADGDPAYTLQANHPHAVCYQGQVGALQARDYKAVGSQYVGEDKLVVECYDARGNGDGETVCTIAGDHQNRITDYTAVAVSWNGENISPTLTANNAGGNQRMPDKDNFNAVIQSAKLPRKYIIRRLTPTECARLQGFPDFWSTLAPYDPADADFWEDVRKTHAEINGKKYKPTKNLKKWYEGLHTDSAEYKMWGNGIALPNARYVMQGIAEQGAKTLGSLFDGSGGFPLAGVLNGIKPVWASEVEPYPIAVTKSRFKEVQE